MEVLHWICFSRTGHIMETTNKVQNMNTDRNNRTSQDDSVPNWKDSQETFLCLLRLFSFTRGSTAKLFDTGPTKAVFFLCVRCIGVLEVVLVADLEVFYGVLFWLDSQTYLQRCIHYQSCPPQKGLTLLLKVILESRYFVLCICVWRPWFSSAFWRWILKELFFRFMWLVVIGGWLVL